MEALDSPGAFQMEYLKELFRNHPWYQLVPDQDGKLVGHGCGENGTFTPAAISKDGKCALIYIPECIPLCVDLTVLEGDRVRAQWFNPRDGESRSIARFNTRGIQRFHPPEDAQNPDFILTLDAN
jgi:hypothetical protein